MYQDFSVVATQADSINKSILISFSLDVDKDTVNESTFQLLDRTSKSELECTYSIKGKEVLMILSDWPNTNAEYILRIQQVKSIIGQELSSGIRKKVVFESSIRATVEIVYPSFNEILNNLKISWRELPMPSTDALVNSFLIEISDDTAFNNVPRRLSVMDRTEIDIVDLPAKQYFTRIRVEKDGQYGLWSEVISFVIKESDGSSSSENPDEPIYVPDIELTYMPENGITPDSIMIGFNQPIDSDSLEGIKILRKGIEKGIERISFSAVTVGDYLEITPNDGMKDNSVYEIELRDLVSADGVAVLDYQKVITATAVTPAYASINSVQSLVESCMLDETKILYNIKEASRFADFVNAKFNHIDIPFEVEQFVRYKAAHDCLLKYHIDRASTAGQKGQIGDVMFDNDPKMTDIKDLLKELSAQVKFWMDSLRGYTEIGRAKPASAVKSIAPKIQTAVGTGGKPLQSVNPPNTYSRGV